MIRIIGLDIDARGHYDPSLRLPAVVLMSTHLPPRGLNRFDWVRRCAARIRHLDDVVSLVDAADLANTLYDLPCCESLEPEMAAARLFQDDLTPSRWTDLSTFCDPKP